MITDIDRFLEDPRASKGCVSRVTTRIKEVIAEEMSSLHDKFGTNGGGEGKLEWSGSTDSYGPATKRYKGACG